MKLLKALFNLLATNFYSDLQTFCPVTLTNQQLPQKEKPCQVLGSLLCPFFLSGSWLKSFSFPSAVRLPKAMFSFQPSMADEKASA